MTDLALLDIEQYRALVEYVPTMVWRATPSGERDYFNATWLAFTGRALEQELGHGWMEGIHPEDAASCRAAYQDQSSREPFELEFRMRRFDGAYRYLSDRAVPYFRDGAFGGFVGSCVDVHERRLREAASGENDFFGMSLDNLCVAGFDGYLKQVNSSWTKTLGWSAEQLLSRPSLEFVHPDDREATLAARRMLTAGSTPGPLVNRYLCKDGSYRWFEWRSVAHRERSLVYAAARDVTDQKLAEARLIEAKELQETLQRQLIFADRMASVGTLAAGVAHELNNPLAYVTGNIAMILEDLEALSERPASGPLGDIREMALEAQAGAERIRKIVLGLKTFSRAEEEQRSIIEIRPVLELAIEMAFHEIKQRGELVREYRQTPLVEADDARLGQVFINLLVNAAQALPASGNGHNEIRVVSYTDTEGRAAIEFRDTGSGIPEALIDRVFDPFFTTKPVGVGTGLGLSISRNIVLGLGGEITVTSVEGRGTTFRVVLPAAPAALQQAALSARPAPLAGAGAEVLVVDDEAAIGAILQRLLREHTVTSVTSAKEALRMLSEGRHFDVILSDVMMPEMSGIGLYDELSQRFPTLLGRIIFISGGAFSPAAQAFLDSVPNAVLPKPFDPQRLRDAVQRLASR
jgi:PAS domain S-box-containing protein